MSRNMWAGIVIAVALVLGVGGCTQQDEADDVTPALRDAAEQQLSWLAQGSGRPATPDIERFHDFNHRLLEDHLRAAAADSFFAVWERDLDRGIWIELAMKRTRSLGGTDRVWDLMRQAGRIDTTSAIHALTSAYLTSLKKPDQRLARFRQAAALAAEDTTLDGVSIRIQAARQEWKLGDPDTATALQSGLMPQAWRAGGSAAASHYWFALSADAYRAHRYDDALLAARVAEACGRASAFPYLGVLATLFVGQLELQFDRYAVAESLMTLGGEQAQAMGFRWGEKRSAGYLISIAGAVGDGEALIRAATHGVELTLAYADTATAVRSTVILANAYLGQGAVDRAVQEFDRADELNQAWIAGDESGFIARGRILLLRQLGDFAAADSLLQSREWPSRTPRERSAAVEQLVISARHCLEINRPAPVYRDLVRARALLARGALRETSYDPYLHVELVAAELYARQGEYDRALASLAIADSLAATETLENNWFLHEVSARIDQEFDDWQGAREHWQRCAEIGAQLNKPDLIRRSRVNLAAGLLEAGRAGEAEQLVADDRDVPELWTRLNAWTVTALARLQTGRPDEALAAIKTARGLDADLPIGFRGRLQVIHGQILLAQSREREALAQFRAARQTLETMVDADDSDLAEAFNHDLTRQAGEAIIGLLRDHPDLADGNVLDQAAEVAGWGRGDRVERTSAPRLEYFLGRDRAFVWFHPGNGLSARWRELSAPDTLTALVEAVRTDAGFPGRDISGEEFQQLGDALLGIIGSDWQAGQTLEIVPDGILHAVPWAALTWHDDDGVPRGPVLRIGPFAMVSGARTSAPAASDGTLLVIAANGGDGGDRPLRQAEAEAEGIAASWHGGPVVRAVGSAAADSTLLGLADTGCRAIHIASHARIFRGRTGDGSIYFAGADGAPLTMSQLAAARINADLVFLSSCEGGRRHRSPGQGVTSFAAAFRHAGARIVVASTVLVDDDAARALAELFYQKWQDGRQVAEALREALLALQDLDPRWAHPFYWSFFNVYQGPGS